MQPGSTFGDYRIDALIGSGGMGVVYRATDLVMGRVVALKLMREEEAGDASYRARFIRETHGVASIDHPNVIPVFQAGECDGRLFIAMRLVEGTDLAKILAEAQQGLEIGRAIALTAQVAAALDAAHRRGLVHRDVKPANVLVSTVDDEHVYLVDFGLSRRVEGATSLTASGRFMGSVAYCAPEQIEAGDVGPRADVYALGCVLFELLSGRPPFVCETEVAVLYAHVNTSAPSLREVAPHVPAALAEIVATTLAKDPEDRYASAGEFARAATRAAAVAPTNAGVPTMDTTRLKGVAETLWTLFADAGAAKRVAADVAPLADAVVARVRSERRARGEPEDPASPDELLEDLRRLTRRDPAAIGADQLSVIHISAPVHTSGSTIFGNSK